MKQFVIQIKKIGENVRLNSIVTALYNSATRQRQLIDNYRALLSTLDSSSINSPRESREDSVLSDSGRKLGIIAELGLIGHNLVIAVFTVSLVFFFNLRLADKNSRL